MNDEQLIQRLEQLKQFKTKDETISALKGRVFSSIENMGPVEAQKTPIGFARYSALFIFRPAFLYPVAALLFIVLIATQGNRLLNTLHVAYLESRVAITSNGYEKARLSLDLAESELKNFEQSNNASAGQIAYLSGVSSETDHYMTSLHLVGEPGQYSSEQCLEAYRAYEDYLGDLNATIQNTLVKPADPSARADLVSLQNQIDRYQQAADAKLKLY